MMDLYRLDGRVALVTGAGGGIGRDICRALGSVGATVVLADRSDRVAASAEALADEGLKTDWIAFDAADRTAIEAAAAEVTRRHGGTDVLVANAGIVIESAALDYRDEDWRKVMAVNLDGVFLAARAFGRGMIDRGWGSIIAISSVAGVRVVRPEHHVAYDVSKAGVAHLCRVLAVEWAKTGVRVNAVAPGYTDTEMLADVGRSHPEVLQTWIDDTPMGRLMTRTEIAAGVAFLAAPAASGITGHVLMVDGGYSVA
jgi:NAD(P)-dependent dehydrogenase (short-subunit alcohol dehydrogenase family)